MGISGELYKLLENYLSNRFQRVLLNGQTSSWKPVLTGVPQGSILGPLLFLVYINDLPDGLKSNAKLFADDTSLFTIVKDKNESRNILNNDLRRFLPWPSIGKCSLTQIQKNLRKKCYSQENTNYKLNYNSTQL